MSARHPKVDRNAQPPAHLGSYFIERARAEMERWFVTLPDADPRADLVEVVHTLRAVLTVKG